MNLLLLETANIFQWVLLGLLLLVIIAAPFYFRFMNKKESDKQTKLIDNLKKGDRVLTAAGIVGKIVSFEKSDNFSLVTIETGTSKNPGYLTLDVYAIVENLSNVAAKANEAKVEEKQEQPAEEVVEEKPVEVQEENEAPVEEEVKEEKPKKPRAKKTTGTTAKKSTSKSKSAKK